MLDLFKFTGSDPTVLEGGEYINGATSVMWTERYRDAGEFEIEAPLSSRLLEFLPAGTLISHVNTHDVMVVENHHIQEDPDADPVLQITGRSLETVLENRIVGSNEAASSNPIVEYVLSSADSAEQALDLINDHIVNTFYPGYQMGNFQGTRQSGLVGGTSEERVIARTNVHSALLEVLAVDNLGVKTVRRNTFAITGNNAFTQFWINRGADRSAQVIFSVKAGDLDGAQYLWSLKSYKNAALVVGRYLNVLVHNTSITGYDRRAMLVDAQDIDGHLDAIPTGTLRTTLLNRMVTRGNQAIKNQNRIAITSADISEVSKYRYRVDYNIGDIVTVDASYGQMRKMRVVEYTEIQDENEFKGYPTLEDPDPED